MLLSQMSSITVNQTYASSNAVTARRDSILKAFDQQIDNAGIGFDLQQRDSLVDMRSATLAHLDEETGNLPDEVDLTIDASVSVWAVANELYGDGLRGEDTIAELCRREGIAQGLYYNWSKEFLEAGKRRLAGDTSRAASTGEVKDLRREARELKEVVAEQMLELRLLKKSMIGDGGDQE